MNRPLRRAERAMDKETQEEILKRGEYGVLGFLGEDGYPRTLPLSYVYDEGRLYFHSAREGEKVEELRQDPRASFTVVTGTQVLPELFSTAYQSVIGVGHVSVVEGEEKKQALRRLLEKYSPEHRKTGEEYLLRAEKATLVYRMDLLQVTGKERKAPPEKED